jgi:uncharacterized protein (TIGR02722 family)
MKAAVTLKSFAALGALALVVSCAPSFQGEYADPNKIEIVDDKWNDSDARLTAEEMISSMLSQPWLATFLQEHQNKRPFILVGDFENRTTEHIDTKALFEAVRAELIKSGKVRFLDGDAREKLLKEYAYQGSGTTRQDQAKAPGKQFGADIFLMGAISSIESEQGGKKRVTYQVEMRLTDIETSEIIFIDTKKITKRFQRSRVKG